MSDDATEEMARRNEAAAALELTLADIRSGKTRSIIIIVSDQVDAHAEAVEVSAIVVNFNRMRESEARSMVMALEHQKQLVIGAFTGGPMMPPPILKGGLNS